MNTKKVLIADDEARICNLIKVLIDWQELGFDICGLVQNGNDALLLCEKYQPDILITDIRMPDLNGLELIKAVKSLLPNIQVIIITGYSQFEYAHQALRYGVVDYLLKPVKKNELIAALRKSIETSEQIEKDKGNSFSGQLSVNYKKDILYQIFNAEAESTNDPDLPQKFLNEYHLDFNGNKWILLTVELFLDESEDSVAVQKYFQKKVPELVFEEFRYEKIHILTAVINNTFFFLLNGNDSLWKITREKLKELKKDFLIIDNLLQKIIYTISFSSMHESINEIYQAKKECQEAIEYKIIAGKNKTISYVDLPRTRFELDFFLDKEFMSRFVSAITEMNITKISGEMAKLSVALYKHISELDAGCVRKIYETLTRSFFATIKVFAGHDDRYSVENVLPEIDSFYSVDSCITYINNVFSSVLNKLKNEKENAGSKTIKQAQLFINEHYAENLTLALLAKEVGLNEAYLSSIFKKQLRISVTDYITQVRIQHAKELLIRTGYDVNGISEKVGFNDSKYFSKRFKKYTGVSPKEYRKLFG